MLKTIVIIVETINKISTTKRQFRVIAIFSLFDNVWIGRNLCIYSFFQRLVLAIVLILWKSFMQNMIFWYLIQFSMQCQNEFTKLLYYFLMLWNILKKLFSEYLFPKYLFFFCTLRELTNWKSFKFLCNSSLWCKTCTESNKIFKTNIL